MNTLQKLKLLLNIQSLEKDDLLKLLIAQVKSEIENYCHTDYVDGMENVLIDMVVVKFSRLGTEGLNAESYSGASYQYSNDYSPSIIRQLNKFRKLVML